MSEPTNPPQEQPRQPGLEHEMTPLPETETETHEGTGKLTGKTAIITGGDSGIGRAVAVLYAREGADLTIAYRDEDTDAQETEAMITAEGRKCVLMRGDVADEGFCAEIVDRTIAAYGRLDILVNNAAEQHVVSDLSEVSTEQLERTFATNVFSMFHLTKAALPHLTEGARIINSTSVTAYQGNPALIDYSATKGAIVAFTRAMSNSLASKGIHVNGVAPGPIWTPLIPASFPAEKVEEFGADTPLGRPGEPEEVAPSYLFLATEGAEYMSGQVLHPNGGQVVNG